MLNTRSIRSRREEDEEVDNFDDPAFFCILGLCKNTKFHHFGPECVL